MRGKDLLEAIEYIDDELVEEALSNTVNITSRPHLPYRKYMYTAAAFAVVLGISAFAYSIFAPSKNAEIAGESGAQTADTSAAESAEVTEIAEGIVGISEDTDISENTGISEDTVISEDTGMSQAAGASQAVSAAADSSSTEGATSTGNPYMSAEIPDNEITDASATDVETQSEKNSSTDQPISDKSKSGNAASEEISDLSEAISADTENDTKSHSEISQSENTKQSHSEMMPTVIEGVTMEAAYIKGSTITVTITNNTDKEIETGDDYCLEYFNETNQSWEDLDLIIDNAAFNAIAYIVPKDKPLELEIDYSWFYGELAPGRYRVSKTIVDFQATGDYDQYTYHAEFTIK